jgi:hypothetical protein
MALVYCTFASAAVLLLFYFVGLCHSSADERRLYEDLKRGYNILERPVENHSLPVTVYLKVSLQQLIDVDEKVNKLSRNCNNLPYLFE